MDNTRSRQSPAIATASDSRLPLLIWTALFTLYVAASRAQVRSYDGKVMADLATRLLTKHTLTIDPAVDTLHMQSNAHVVYGFGTTLLVLPFDAAQRAVHAAGGGILTLANPAVLGGCGVVLFLIGRRLHWRTWVCVATALGFGALTTALWQSTEMLSEPGVALGSLLVVLGVLVWTDASVRGSLLVGIGVASSMLFRPDSIVLVAPLALVVVWRVSAARRWTRRTIAGVAVPAVIVGTFQLWYDQYRYGSVWSTGIAQQARGLGFNTPIVKGLDLILRSPGRGFFWTAPILLLALPGMFTLYRRERPLTVAIALVVVARFLLVAHWWTPAGGLAWGPRLLFPATALLAIPAGDFVQRVTEWLVPRDRVIAWTLIASLAIVSATISFLSVAVGYDTYWIEWTRTPTRAVAQQRVHAYYWSIGHGPILGHLHLLTAGHELAPQHFRNGADAIGILMITTALAATISAFVMCRHNDAPRNELGASAVLSDGLEVEPVTTP